jgi:2-C-methyl-D-erythritol 2,4-cyclodiphosphate synthase
MTEKNFIVGNLDSTVVAERPKIGSFIPRMKEQIAGALRISPQQINIKATTSEGLGFIGEEKGMAAYAVVLLQEARSTGGFKTRPYRARS